MYWLASALLLADRSSCGGLVNGDRGGVDAFFISQLGIAWCTEEGVHSDLFCQFRWCGQGNNWDIPLERNTLGLRNQKPGENKHREAEASKDEVSSISSSANSCQHVRDSLSYDKIEQPLGGSGDSYIHGSQTRSRDLRYENPADGSPSELEECSKQEDARQGNIAEWWNICALHRWEEANIEADDEHCNALSDGSPQQ